MKNLLAFSKKNIFQFISHLPTTIYSISEKISLLITTTDIFHIIREKKTMHDYVLQMLLTPVARMNDLRDSVLSNFSHFI